MRKNNKYKPKTILGSNTPKALSFCNNSTFENLALVGNRNRVINTDRIEANRLADFLLYLKDECGDHDSIIKGKHNYIIGNGLKYTNASEPLNIKVNLTETLYSLLSKCLKDYLIFGYFTVEVVYNAMKEPTHYYHIPAQKISTNYDKSLFAYKDNGNTEVIFEAFNPNVKSDTSKVFGFFSDYGSGVIYPTVEYNSIFIPALTDIAISKFNLNNIKNHFSLASIITHYNGTNLSEEVKSIIYEQYEGMYSGEVGKKFLVDFQNPDGKGISVENIGANDWDKAYIEVSKNVSEKIQTGHSIVSPMLFGIKTAGQLGGSTEIENAYQIFQLSEGNAKRKDLSDAFNYLFEGSSTIKGELDFDYNKSLLSEEVSFDNKMSFMTVNEIRESQGLKPIEGMDIINFNKTIENEK